MHCFPISQKLNSLRFIIHTNKASIRVAEKCGYKFEKNVPAVYEKDDKKINAKLYAIENSNIQV